MTAKFSVSFLLQAKYSKFIWINLILFQLDSSISLIYLYTVAIQLCFLLLLVTTLVQEVNQSTFLFFLVDDI